MLYKALAIVVGIAALLIWGSWDELPERLREGLQGVGAVALAPLVWIIGYDFFGDGTFFTMALGSAIMALAVIMVLGGIFLLFLAVKW